MSDTLTLAVAQIVPATDAEGPGCRFALWFQGCPLRCPGCCNPEFLPFTGGEAMTLGDVVALLDTSVRDHVIEGISLLGGEPFAHAVSASALAKIAHDRDLSVMVYSGYTLGQLRRRADAAPLLAHTDLLVDGPYLRDHPEQHRRWVGSTNQQVHFLTDRHDPADPCWTRRNTLEIRIDRTAISINGFPATNAVALWKGWTRKERPE